jgi:uracil-DNA glycosylase
MQTKSVEPKINEEWKSLLKEEFDAPYFEQLKSFLIQEKASYTVYPPGPQIFSALNKTPFSQVKVVILGQDPYHGPGQANGFCFSVSEGIKHPPSLVNIFKELENNLGIPYPKSGNLEKWAEQGVLLLNAILTVRANSPASHQNKGWENFTDAIIKNLSDKRSGLIFLLWGSFAQAKVNLIDTQKHHVLKAAHPSPFSVHRGFFGCQHFSKANEILRNNGQKPIDWNLSNV